jgi:demethylmenaquinone methyltransferase/2-methoxy-6-polyprenyl-1,4-benzoquinol methylase
MKVLESSPARYDRGMQLLTLGQLSRVHRDITDRVAAGDRVLDIGCGTGALAARLAQRGASVVAIDVSPEMLDRAAGRLEEAGMAGRVALRELGVAELDRFEAGAFDVVTGVLVFSELSNDEVAYTLEACERVLDTGGRLMVADEVMPASLLGRIGTWLLRLPFAVLAFVLAQSTTRRVAGLRARMEAAGFEVVAEKRYLLGTLRLYLASVTSQH